MTSNKAVRAALVAALAATGLAACGAGSDGVASPGEGSFVPSPPPAPPVSPPVSPPASPPSGPAANCPTVAGNAQPFVNVGIVAGLRNCQLPSLIIGAFNVPKTAGVIYSVSSVADVGQDRGGDANAPLGGTASGILSIDPGVVIFGSGGLDFIRVNRGSQIQASGTAADPIIFTSRGDVENAALADEAPGGQWGGLLILGRAPINDGCPAGQNQQITAAGPPATSPIVCQTLAEATNAFYGGNSPTDNSGRLSYLLVKYPGFNVTPNKELNGITLSGVGNGTQVENVQVHQSSDDGIEIFGGTVNVKNAVLTGSDDDSFDTDLGWRGAAQYLLIVQRTTGGDRGFEWSAHESTVPPNLDGAGQQIYRSQPRVSNATIVMRSNVGTPAILENLGTQGFIYNSVFTRQANTGQCLDIDNTYTLAAGGQTFQSVFFSCGATAFTNDADVDGTATAAEFNKAGNGVNNTAVGVSTLTARTGASTSFVNGVNENAVAVQTPANSGAANGVVSTFLTTPGKIGAVFPGNDTWYQGWTCSPMIGEESC